MNKLLKLSRRTFIVVVAFAIPGLGVIFPASIVAAPPSGITITPSQILATIKPDDVRRSYDIELTNHSQQPVQLALSTVDFEGLDQSGGVLFVGQTPSQFTQHYGLSKWLTLDQSNVSLSPGQSGKITATLNNTQSLSPGGHYGAVVATVTSPGQTKGVSIQSSIASLFFVTKQGGGAAQLQLQTLEPNRNWLGRVLSSTANFSNSGNIHVIPRGIIQVIDPANRVIGKGVINANSSILLPGQHRSFDVPLLQLGWPWLPGTYRVASQYRTDDGQSLQTKIVTFQEVGLLAPLVIALILTAAISFLLIHRARRKLHAATHT